MNQGAISIPIRCKSIKKPRSILSSHFLLTRLLSLQNMRSTLSTSTAVDSLDCFNFHLHCKEGKPSLPAFRPYLLLSVTETFILYYGSSVGYGLCGYCMRHRLPRCGRRCV